MNYRNLSFIIVLFLVWLMGYYYYSPQKGEVNTQQEHAQETKPTMTQPIEAPAAAEQTEHMPEQTIVEVSAPPVATHTEVQPVAQPTVHKKKRTKKEKRQAKAAVATALPVVQVKPAPVQSSNDSSLTHTITIASGLTKKDIGYYKMLSWHYPHLFNLTINSKPLFTKNNKDINSYTMTLDKEQPFVVRYDYEWHTPWGKRIGAKKVTFKAHSDTTSLTVRFMSNWKEEERIVVDGATKISAELLEEAS